MVILALTNTSLMTSITETQMEIASASTQPELGNKHLTSLWAIWIGWPPLSKSIARELVVP